MISTFTVDNTTNYQSSKRAKVNFASLAAISKADEVRKDDNEADSKLSKIDWAIDPVSECVCPSAPGTAGQVASRSHTCLYRLCHMYWNLTSPSFSLSKFLSGIFRNLNRYSNCRVNSRVCNGHSRQTWKHPLFLSLFWQYSD